MKRLLAFGAVALALVLAAWIVWGGGDGPARRPGSSRTKADAPALRWSGGGEARDPSEHTPRAEPGAVAGKVIDAIDGRPIAGATVTLRSGSGEELDETSSEEDGAFSFAESGEAVLVVAAAPGYAMRAKDLDPGEIVLELDGAVTVSGVVVDPAGDPVEGAEVWIEDRERAFFHPPTVSSTVRTNAEGRFAVEDSPSGTLLAHAEHPEYAAGTLELGGLGPGRQRDGVRIEMRDTGALTGRVTDESGEPVAQARVSWTRDEERRAGRFEPEVTTTSGADGRYRFAHLPAGKAA